MTELIKPYSRLIPNWISGFKAWTLPRTEVDEQLILWTAVWTLAASLRRRVFIPKESGLGGWTCYPFLYVIFVAPPGYRKTVTVNFAMDLLEQVPNFPLPPTFITQAALVESIKTSPDSSIYITAEEFGDLIIKGGTEMYETLTSMFDGKKRITQKTMLRGIEGAEKPTINMIAGTTPKWIARNMPEGLIGGGFASRVIWVYTDKLRHKKLWHDMTKVNMSMKLEAPLVEDLKHIAQLEGPFSVPDEFKAISEQWYIDLEERYKGFKYDGYIQRKHVMALKLSQIMHIAYSDDLTLTVEDFNNAVALLESSEANLDKAFQGIGKNEYALEMKDIVRFVQDKSEVSAQELRRYFENAASPIKFQELLDGVLLLGYLVSTTKEVEGKPGIYFKPGK